MFKHLYRSLVFVILVVAPVWAGQIQLHSKAQQLPHNHQGPFVTTGDGAVLGISRTEALISQNEGKTWKTYPLFNDPGKFEARDERTLLRTVDGTVVLAFMNEKERQAGKWGSKDPAEFEKWVLPVYVTRSFDDGKTWEEPIQIQRRWCGAIRCLIQLESGRLVLVGQTITPWRHQTLTYVSDDDGKTWKVSNILDLPGNHDHSGAMEATIAERADGSILMYIRTTEGWQYQAESFDGGLTWKNLKNSGIQSNTCCATLARLADGRLAMLWNRYPNHNPSSVRSREELSIAFSGDDGVIWSKPQVLAGNYVKEGDALHSKRLGYPWLYEKKPGQFWITTMQGDLRMKINEADLDTSPDPTDAIRPLSIVMLGDSTTATRGDAIKKVYACRVQEALTNEGIASWVTNSGIGGDTTEGARARLEHDVLAHNPDLVVIQFGINDSAIDVHKDPPQKEPRISPKQYEANLRYLVDECLKKKAKVVLMTTNQMRWTDKLKSLYGKPPYNPNDPMSFNDTTLRGYNEIVRKVAREKNVSLVDIHVAYDEYEKKTGKTVDSILLDGMHPGDFGHELVTEMLLPAIRKELNLPKSPIDVTLALLPSKENPRNSEGDFIEFKDGRILFVYTHFIDGGRDHSKAFLAGRYSSDDGKTWTNEDVVIMENDAGMNLMSVSLLRLNDGQIALFYLRKNSSTDCRPEMRLSADEGKTWSEPVICIPDDDLGYYVLNNDRAVQLSSGRIILPVALHRLSTEPKTDWAGKILCYFSDDLGKTWKRSKSVLLTKANDGERIITQEPGIIELADGRLMIYARTGSGSQYVGYSSDSGDTWTDLKPSSLKGPRSPALIERISGTGELLCVWNYQPGINPKGKHRRTPFTIAISRDEGKSWENVRYLHRNPWGHYCYPAVHFVDDGILIGYCAGDRTVGGLNRTCITRLPLKFIRGVSNDD
jgi:lysophospholipase L1-like esterase